MHTSTGRFLFSRRSPSKRRAFLGVFNITKSFGRHDTCRRPRISLQIKRYKPITPPIIRRKHRELPIFCPRSVCRDLRLQNTRKNARRHHPHMARSKIRTTLKKGGLLLGYNPRAPGSRLKARARTSSRPSASWPVARRSNRQHHPLLKGSSYSFTLSLSSAMSWDSCSLMYLAIVASFRPTVDT